MTDPARIATEARTAHWMEENFTASVERTRAEGSSGVFDDAGVAVGMNQDEFFRLQRRLKIFRWLDRLAPTSFLDVASGWDHYPWLARERYGIDVHWSDLVHELNLPTCGLEIGKQDRAVTLNLASLPFRDDSFDVVLCSEVFEHLVRPVEAISELLRVSRRHVILTSLEGLSPDPLRRWLSHHRIDVRLPHVERNFLLEREFEALLGQGLHHECLQDDGHAPFSLFAPEAERQAGYAGLRDPDALARALAGSVSSGGHGPGTMGILLVKAKDGSLPAPPRREDDLALARWLVDRAAELDRYHRTILAVWEVFRTRPETRPREPDPERPVADSLLALLRCPDCRRGALSRDPARPTGVRCEGCGARFPGSWGVPILHPGEHAGDLVPAAEALARLCGDDAGRRRAVEGVMRRLRHAEAPPSRLRRLAWRVERSLGWMP